MVGFELPLYRISSTGNAELLGKFVVFHNNKYALEPGGHVLMGLPLLLADMTPQGFLGRAFAQKFGPELEISNRPQDWGNDQILVALARRGEDLAGDLLVGKESAVRFEERSMKMATRAQFPALAASAIEGTQVGSSAGGERPKFTACVDGRHCLIKFVAPESPAVAKRWGDLLRLENLALDILQSAGIAAAQSELLEISGQLFLEIERFDRLGTNGRRAVLSLAGVEDTLYGRRDTWAASALRLERDRWISADDARRIRFMDVFGAWIGDSDRHFHNIVFFPELDKNNPLEFRSLRLAPAFDKVPMALAPNLGVVPNKPLPIPSEHPDFMDVWQDALLLATEYWERCIQKDSKLSDEVQELARTHLKSIKRKIK